MSHKTKANRPQVYVALTVIAFTLTAPFGLSQKATEDLPPGPMQAKATTSCLECHEARIILQQRLNKGAWTKEVDKMVKWGALVDANDHDALIDYLSANFPADKAAYEAQGTEVTTGRKTPKTK